MFSISDQIIIAHHIADKILYDTHTKSIFNYSTSSCFNYNCSHDIPQNLKDVLQPETNINKIIVILK